MSANSAIRAATIRHQVGLQRLASGLVAKIIRLLDAADADLVAAIEKRTQAIADRGFDTGPFTTSRLKALLSELRTINRDVYRAAGRELRAELKELAEYEVGFTREMWADSIGADLREGRGSRIWAKGGQLHASFLRPSVEQLVAIVDSQPFQGAILSRWVSALEAGRLQALERGINLGLVAGESVDQLVRRVRGTRAGSFQDGILALSRRHAETWVRTAVGHVSNSARDALYDANSDVISALVWTSTLDFRTTLEYCVPRDGKRYTLDRRPIGHSLSWGAGPGRLHPRCRSTSTAALKSWRELGVDLDEAFAGTRASLDGQVPESTTAEDFLRQHADDPRTRALFGASRYKLWRDGGLSAEDLVKSPGEKWTLKELQQRETAAFRRAGLAA